MSSGATGRSSTVLVSLPLRTQSTQVASASYAESQPLDGDSTPEQPLQRRRKPRRRQASGPPPELVPLQYEESEDQVCLDVPLFDTIDDFFMPRRRRAPEPVGFTKKQERVILPFFPVTFGPN
jgi:hypothetical protein